MKWTLPPPVTEAIRRLEEQGFEAAAVGGCVRDLLLGREPHDWDLTTSALPEQTAGCFAERPLLGVGMKHGTVTVLWDEMPLEITTYRVEDGYTDGRRPDQVRFVRRLQDDLARRDFTVNAMAYHPVRGVLDPFGGEEDLAAGRLRCVGNPALRFREDALRIFRALRFAAVYGFAVEQDTARALHQEKAGLRRIAAERIREELCRMLVGKDVGPVLAEYGDVMAETMPLLAPMRDFDQRNPHHDKDVWTHTVSALAQSPGELTVRLVLLFHDAGKPESFTLDEQGVGHFYGHPARSAVIADQTMRDLRFDNETRTRVCRLVEMHDAPLDTMPRTVRRWLRRLGEEDFRRMLQIKRADTLAQAPAYQPPRLAMLDNVQREMERILSQQACFSLRDLAVNGRDLIEAGVPEGPAVGRTLTWLLDQVVDGTLPNDREALLGTLEISS